MMVFIEFISLNFPTGGGKHYFVGASHEDVMADTAGGTKFGFASFSSHREISEKEARALNLGYLEAGIISIQRGRSKNYKLDAPVEQCARA